MSGRLCGSQPVYGSLGTGTTADCGRGEPAHRKQQLWPAASSEASHTACRLSSSAVTLSFKKALVQASGWQAPAWTSEASKVLVAGGVAGAVSKSATAPLARLTILLQASLVLLAVTDCLPACVLLFPLAIDCAAAGCEREVCRSKTLQLTCRSRR